MHSYEVASNLTSFRDGSAASLLFCNSSVITSLSCSRLDIAWLAYCLWYAAGKPHGDTLDDTIGATNQPHCLHCRRHGTQQTPVTLCTGVVYWLVCIPLQCGSGAVLDCPFTRYTLWLVSYSIMSSTVSSVASCYPFSPASMTTMWLNCYTHVLYNIYSVTSLQRWASLL